MTIRRLASLKDDGLSDHAVVKFFLKWQTSTSNDLFRPRRWNYCKLNPAKLTALAEELNWNKTTKADSVEIQWANIKKCRTVATR